MTPEVRKEAEELADMWLSRALKMQYSVHDMSPRQQRGVNAEIHRMKRTAEIMLDILKSVDGGRADA